MCVGGGVSVRCVWEVELVWVCVGDGVSVGVCGGWS